MQNFKSLESFKDTDTNEQIRLLNPIGPKGQIGFFQLLMY